MFFGTSASDPYRTPPPVKKSNKNAAQWERKRAEYYNNYNQGIDYYSSLHSGFPPPYQEETENDREDNEDVEDEPARKSSRRDRMITENTTTYFTYFCFYNFDYGRNHTFGINMYNIYACLHTHYD